MKEWITSIASIITITSIFTLIVPEGRIGRYIKGILSILVIFLIIQPVFSLKNGQSSYGEIITQNKVELQTNYIDFITQSKVKNYEAVCIKKIEELGVKNAEVNINYQLLENGDFKIIFAQINLKNSVIISDKKHIDILEQITYEIANYLIITEDLVTIYE